MFRKGASTAVMRFVLVERVEADPAFDYRTLRRPEGPIWALVSRKPQHLLDLRFADTPQSLLSKPAN